MKKTPLHNLIDKYQKQVEMLESELKEHSDVEHRLITDEIDIKKIFIEDLQNLLPGKKVTKKPPESSGYEAYTLAG